VAQAYGDEHLFENRTRLRMAALVVIELPYRNKDEETTAAAKVPSAPVTALPPQAAETKARNCHSTDDKPLPGVSSKGALRHSGSGRTVDQTMTIPRDYRR
jgi:hypothetical protein